MCDVNQVIFPAATCVCIGDGCDCVKDQARIPAAFAWGVYAAAAPVSVLAVNLRCTCAPTRSCSVWYACAHTKYMFTACFCVRSCSQGTHSFFMVCAHTFCLLTLPLCLSACSNDCASVRARVTCLLAQAHAPPVAAPQPVQPRPARRRRLPPLLRPCAAFVEAKYYHIMSGRDPLVQFCAAGAPVAPPSGQPVHAAPEPSRDLHDEVPTDTPP